MTFAFAVFRAVQFAGLTLLFGAGAFAWIARARRGIDARLSRRVFAGATIVAVVSAMVCLGFVAAEMTGEPGAMFDPASLWAVASDTLYGRVALLRLAFLALCLSSTWVWPEQRDVAAAVLGGFVLALLGLSSHAAAAGPSQYAFTRAGNDAVHLLAAGFWIGGLAALLPFALAARREAPKLIAVLRLFSSFGMAAVAILIVSGTLNGYLVLFLTGMRWSDSYLTWLAVKLVLAGIMIALALTNRFGILPGQARGEKEAAETIPLTVIAELSCAALILLAVGFLGLTAPMEM